MRTNVDINDNLLREAMELANTKTKKETIERALHELVRDLKRKRVLSMRGKVKWEGDLNEMRSL